MAKFTWQNGTLVSKAKVEIDGTIYEVDPEEYSGATPLSAGNLNAMQDGIYDDIGNLTTLETTNKENVVSSINELNNVKSLRLKKLWENPNPGADIGGSGYKIVLNSNDYDYLVLIYAIATDCRYMKSAISLKGHGFCLDYVDSFWTGSSYSGPAARRRYINYVNDTELNAQGSEYYQAGIAVFQQPGTNIPIAIYGGKF